MNYEPKALPPHLNELFSAVSAANCSRALVVGSALRDADNNKPVTTYSLFVMPPRGISVDKTADGIKAALSTGTRLGRVVTGEAPRFEYRMGSGPLLRLTLCHRPEMLTADTIVGIVPVGASAIALDLFSSNVSASSVYRLDQREATLTVTRPEGREIALGIQRTRYPERTVVGIDGRVLSPAPAFA